MPMPLIATAKFPEPVEAHKPPRPHTGHNLVDLLVEERGHLGKAHAVAASVARALELPVVDQEPPQGDVVAVDLGRDLGVPRLQESVDLAFGVDALAVDAHHDALHQDVAVAPLARKRARPAVGTQPENAL